MVTANRELYGHLQAAGALRVTGNEPLWRHTTFRIGGPVRWFIEVGDESPLGRILQLLGEEGVPHLLLGGGSNVLAPDQELESAAVRLRGNLARVAVAGRRVRAGAGAALATLAAAARDAALSGLEFAGTIPGTLGGALAGNAGYGGACIGELVASVTLLLPDGTVAVLPRDGVSFAYRSSSIAGQGAILGATFDLTRGDPERIAALMRRLADQRRATQPLGQACAGCVFRNPPGHAAGRLIDEAGLRGLIEGNAQVSDVHANFIVNRGDARAADVTRLIATVAERVKARFGISLSLELHILSSTP